MNIRQTLFGLVALCAASSGHALGPAAGSYTVDATFFVQDVSPTGTDVYVQRNGSTNLYTDRLAYGGAGNVATYSGTVTLASGGTVDFVVGNAGNYFFDSTGIGVQITAVPEPQTYALLAIGLGLVGFAVRRKQRG